MSSFQLQLFFVCVLSKKELVSMTVGYEGTVQFEDFGKLPNNKGEKMNIIFLILYSFLLDIVCRG